MKTFIALATPILLLLVFSGCNPDVFVEDFSPSVSELALDGNGDQATIRFKASNWEILEVVSVYSDIHHYKVYDEDDKLMAEGTPYLEGLGKIVLEERDIDFTVERTAPQEVKITVGENIRATPLQFIVAARNEYEWKEIIVTISPSDRYVFDHITYSLDGYFYDEPVNSVKKIEVYNSMSSAPSTCILFPFKDRHRRVTFASKDPHAFELLQKEELTLEIPSMEGGKLQMSGVEVQYTSESQNLPLPFPDTEKKEVVVPAYTDQRVTLLIQSEWFETEYTLYATHPKTGKQRIITGTLQSSMPKKYYVTREAIKY